MIRKDANMPARDWNAHYESGELRWESGRPSSELARIIAEEKIAPCRAIDLGCGTGINSVWLAQHGFDVTGVDLTALAIERARRRAEEAGVAVQFIQADVLDFPAGFELQPGFEPYPFFFDRGCYHCVRELNVQAYVRTLTRLTGPGSVGLILTGNAKEPRQPGPPVVSEEQLRSELEPAFEIVRLREFRFDEPEESGPGPLAWSCLVRRGG
jgi:methyl halide transferase